MSNTAIRLENDAARAELQALEGRLGPESYADPVGSNWTIASALCHLVFWDQKALSHLEHWSRIGKVEAARLDPESVESINRAVNFIALQVPGPGALKMALESAAAVDAFVAGIEDELAEKISEAGFERLLRRSLHRREHLEKIHAALGAR
jgi:hypothetical protein